LKNLNLDKSEPKVSKLAAFLIKHSSLHFPLASVSM
jgi:hypothetical protein